MAIEIPVRKDSSAFTQNLSLLGQSVTLGLTFNSTDKKWRLDLFNAQGNSLLRGRLLVNNQSPSERYKLNALVGGNFWVFKKKATDSELGYNNLGFNKDYGLFFLTTAEEEELGL